MHALLAARLSRDHGLITTAAALQLGITPTVLRNMVRRGALVRVHQGVYRHVAAPLTLEQTIRAGMLAVGERAVLSHRAALARHGVRNFECNLVEIRHRSASMPVREGMVVHRSTTLGSADVERLHGVWTTTRPRTVIDAAAVMAPSLVARYAFGWIAERRMRLDALEACAERAGNHGGARHLLEQLATINTDADSRDEARLGEILAGAGVGPELHVLVTTATGHTFELDWAYPRWRLGLEVDGYGVHLRSVAAFDDDRWRRNELEIAGWTILNFTSRQLRRPASVVDQVHRAIAVSSSRSLGPDPRLDRGGRLTGERR